jgi:hypothetical protein
VATSEYRLRVEDTSDSSDRPLEVEFRGEDALSSLMAAKASRKALWSSSAGLGEVGIRDMQCQYAALRGINRGEIRESLGCSSRGLGCDFQPVIDIKGRKIIHGRNKPSTIPVNHVFKIRSSQAP